MEPERALAEMASHHHGVFTISEAESCGISRRGIEYRAARGVYRRVAPGVYVVAASPDSWRRALVVAARSAGDLGAASHKTAAFVWGMSGWQPDVTETVTRRWDRRRREFIVHESKDLIETDIVEHEGIPVTIPERTVVDTGASASRRFVEMALDTGLRKGLFTLEDVDRFVARVARRGRRGIGVIRPLIAARWGWETKTESELEDLFRRVLADGALPQPEPQYVVHDEWGGILCRADFAYPTRRLLIELDSEAFHMDRETFQRDRDKQNQTLALGWRTLRFTWKHLFEEPEAVRRRIASVLA